MNKLKRIPLTRKQKWLLIFVGLILFGSVLKATGYESPTNETEYTEYTQTQNIVGWTSMLYIGLVVIQPRKETEGKVKIKRNNKSSVEDRPQWMINQEKEKERLKLERIKFLENNFTHLPAHSQRIFISSIRNSLIILPYNMMPNSIDDLITKEISLDEVLSIELAAEEEQITNGVAKQGKSKTRTSLTNMAVRGAVGSLINPAVGVVGALTASKKTKHRDQISSSVTKMVRDYSLVFYIAGKSPIIIQMGQQETVANNALQQVIYLINKARQTEAA